MTWFIPVHTVSEANAHRHFRHRQRRAKIQRGAVAMLCRHDRPPLTGGGIVVKLTRVSPRPLDGGDNLPVALKAVRDEIAALYGVNDRDPRITWSYDQIRIADERNAGVRIEIKPADPLAEWCNDLRLIEAIRRIGDAAQTNLTDCTETVTMSVAHWRLVRDALHRGIEAAQEDEQGRGQRAEGRGMKNDK
jgi:hypothetical protein